MAEGFGQTAAIHGRIDTVTRQEVRGWALSRAEPGRRLAVELVCAGRVVSLAPVNQMRQDLAALGAGRIDLGFTLRIPANTPVDFELLQVRIVGSGEELALTAAHGALEGVVDHAYELRVAGWAWRIGAPEERVTVTISYKGDPVANVTADLLRHDLVEAGVGDGRHAFVVDLQHLPGGHAFDMDHVDVRFEQNGHPLHDLRHLQEVSTPKPPAPIAQPSAPSVRPPAVPAPPPVQAPRPIAAPARAIQPPPPPAAIMRPQVVPVRALQTPAPTVTPPVPPAPQPAPVEAAPPPPTPVIQPPLPNPTPAPAPEQPAPPALSREVAEALLGSINFGEDEV